MHLSLTVLEESYPEVGDAANSKNVRIALDIALGIEYEEMKWNMVEQIFKRLMQSCQAKDVALAEQLLPKVPTSSLDPLMNAKGRREAILKLVRQGLPKTE